MTTNDDECHLRATTRSRMKMRLDGMRWRKKMFVESKWLRKSEWQSSHINYLELKNKIVYYDPTQAFAGKSHSQQCYRHHQIITIGVLMSTTMSFDLIQFKFIFLSLPMNHPSSTRTSNMGSGQLDVDFVRSRTCPFNNKKNYSVSSHLSVVNSNRNYR